MKKLLTITILLTTFIQANNEEVKDEHLIKRDVCEGLPSLIYKRGISPCKAGDILYFLDPKKYATLSRSEIKYAYSICVWGTTNFIPHDFDKLRRIGCILKAEEDFSEHINHFKIR